MPNANYYLPTDNINSPFYMREVNRHKRTHGYYPEYFLSEVPWYECKICGKSFTAKWIFDLMGRNLTHTCVYCITDRKFKNAAHQNIRINCKLAIEDQPDWLVDSVAIYLKTKFSLADRQTFYKIKVPEYDHNSNQFV